MKHASSSDDDDDFDPGREVVEKNQRDRLQRMADHTRDELNRVLQRVEYVSKHSVDLVVPHCFSTINKFLLDIK